MAPEPAKGEHGQQMVGCLWEGNWKQYHFNQAIYLTVIRIFVAGFIQSVKQREPGELNSWTINLCKEMNCFTEEILSAKRQDLGLALRLYPLLVRHFCLELFSGCVQSIIALVAWQLTETEGLCPGPAAMPSRAFRWLKMQVTAVWQHHQRKALRNLFALGPNLFCYLENSSICMSASPLAHLPFFCSSISSSTGLSRWKSEKRQ